MTCRGWLGCKRLTLSLLGHRYSALSHFPAAIYRKYSSVGGLRVVLEGEGEVEVAAALGPLDVAGGGVGF